MIVDTPVYTLLPLLTPPLLPLIIFLGVFVYTCMYIVYSSGTEIWNINQIHSSSSSTVSRAKMIAIAEEIIAVIWQQL